MTSVEMPYARGAGCDLCGHRAPLRRVVLQEGDRQHLPRVAYICDAHGDPSGPVVQAPATRQAEGTTRLHPQAEELF